MNTIRGDLLAYAARGRFDAILHGCNCFCTMSGGIAASIRSRFPEAWRADNATVSGDKAKLGTYTAATIDISSSTETERKAVTVINAYTQYSYAPTKEMPIPCDYDAIECVMAQINREYSGKAIGLPQIGAGLAGGDWRRIEEIITRCLTTCNVTLVLFDSAVHE